MPNLRIRHCWKFWCSAGSNNQSISLSERNDLRKCKIQQIFKSIKEHNKVQLSLIRCYWSFMLSQKLLSNYFSAWVLGIVTNFPKFLEFVIKCQAAVFVLPILVIRYLFWVLRFFYSVHFLIFMSQNERESKDMKMDI